MLNVKIRLDKPDLYKSPNPDNINARLPPVVTVSEGKLVQVGSGNTSPDTQGTF